MFRLNSYPFPGFTRRAYVFEIENQTLFCFRRQWAERRDVLFHAFCTGIFLLSLGEKKGFFPSNFILSGSCREEHVSVYLEHPNKPRFSCKLGNLNLKILLHVIKWRTTMLTQFRLLADRICTRKKKNFVAIMYTSPRKRGVLFTNLLKLHHKLRSFPSKYISIQEKDAVRKSSQI